MTFCSYSNPGFNNFASLGPEKHSEHARPMERISRSSPLAILRTFWQWEIQWQRQQHITTSQYRITSKVKILLTCLTPFLRTTIGCSSPAATRPAKRLWFVDLVGSSILYCSFRDWKFRNVCTKKSKVTPEIRLSVTERLNQSNQHNSEVISIYRWLVVHFHPSRVRK